MWVRHRAHQAAHQRLGSAAAQDPVRPGAEGHRDLTVSSSLVPRPGTRTAGEARGWLHASVAATPCRRRARRDRRGQSGSVTAETVMVLPVLVAVTLGLAWTLALAITQARVVDAAREVARAVARDDGSSTALALGRRVAPAGARIRVRPSADTVVVRVDADVRGPGGLFAFVPVLDVHAEAVAACEPGGVP